MDAGARTRDLETGRGAGRRTLRPSLSWTEMARRFRDSRVAAPAATFKGRPGHVVGHAQGERVRSDYYNCRETRYEYRTW